MNTTTDMKNGNVASGATSSRVNNGASQRDKNGSSAAAGLGTVIGAGSGAVAGVVIGTALTPEEASASDSVQATVEAVPVSDEQVHAEAVQPVHETHNSYVSTTHVSNHTHVEYTEPTQATQPAEPGETDEVEVVSFERVTDPETGESMDLAVVIENGEEVAYVDIDIDGVADYRLQDVNNNGNIEMNNSEVQDISGQNISMEPFREAYESQPDFNSNNDMADYVNDANVDNFMA